MGGVEERKKKKAQQSWSPTFFPWVICKHSAVSRTVMSRTVRDARSKSGHVLINIIRSQDGISSASPEINELTNHSQTRRLFSSAASSRRGSAPPPPPCPARPTGEAAATRTTWKISARRRGSPHLSAGPPRFPSVRARTAGACGTPLLRACWGAVTRTEIRMSEAVAHRDFFFFF